MGKKNRRKFFSKRDTILDAKIIEHGRTIFRTKEKVDKGFRKLNSFGDEVLNLPIMDDLFFKKVGTLEDDVRKKFGNPKKSKRREL